MAQTIHLSGGDVPAAIKAVFPSYKGRTYRVRITDKVALTGTQWSGGSRSTYRGVNLATGQSAAQDPRSLGEWFNPQEPRIDLSENSAIVEHSIFAGKDMGITIHLHPTNAAKLLPTPQTMGETESAVLEMLSSTIGGYRQDAWERAGWPGRYKGDNPLIEGLVALGYVKVNRAGAVSVTIDGKNARPA